MDSRPKRRKTRDNPYTLESIEEMKIYRVSFCDNTGKKYTIDINQDIFEVLNQFELDDLKLLNEYDRHIEHLEQSDETLYKKSKIKEKNTETKLLEKFMLENLYKKISELPDIQKRRIKMYFFEDMTLQEIANIEHCSCRAVKYSIDAGLSKLRKNLKK